MAATDAPIARAVPQARRTNLSVSRVRPELVGLLGLAAALNLWSLGRNGWANEYYSAAVRSMSSSWHAFLYGSFDASGVMTVDKPPLALWVQALSVRVFGFHPLSILVPEALMGVAAVGLVYDLTRRVWGRGAGFVAGLALATTPIAVAIARHNNPDALLVLCCTGALWCLVRGLQDGRTRWIVLAGVCVGLGFEAKMAAALLVVPAIAVAWLWVAPRGRAAAARAVAAGGAAMAIVGGAWPLLMALTPASERPWIAGTSDNSIWSLILGYNGLGRLSGQAGGPGGAAAGAAGGGPFGGAGGGAFGGGGPFGGSAGVLRLLNSALGGQDGWLLGFAIVGGLGLLAATRLRRRDPRTGWLLGVAGAFATIAVAFSAARGIFHPYYVSELAPFTAALAGATAGWLTSRERLARVVGPLAIAGGVATELVVLHENPGGLTWLAPLLVVGGAVAAAALALQRVPRGRAIAVAAVVGVLLIAPAAWAEQTLGHATSGTFPAGGPASASAGAGFGRGFARPAGAPPVGAIPGGPGRTRAGPGGPGGPGGRGGGSPFGEGDQSVTEAVRYAQRHGGGTVALSSQTSAASAIIANGSAVAGIGGFSGRESEVTTTWLADAIRSGQIRWVLVEGTGIGGLAGDTRVGASRVEAAVASTCRKATTLASGAVLYDCSGRAAALAAA